MPKTKKRLFDVLHLGLRWWMTTSVITTAGSHATINGLLYALADSIHPHGEMDFPFSKKRPSFYTIIEKWRLFPSVVLNDLTPVAVEHFDIARLVDCGASHLVVILATAGPMTVRRFVTRP